MTKSTLSRLLLNLAVAVFIANGAFADAEVTQVSGSVEIGRGDPAKWSRAQTGDVVESNDRVRTGADGRVEIKMDAGILRVHENSVLRLPPAVANADQVELEEGRSLFDVLRRSGRRFEVHTPTVVVSVKGTRFGVDAGIDIGEVTVYRGTVGVREVGAEDMVETLVREGFLATGGAGIPIELDVSATADPWRTWQEFDRAQEEDRKRPQRMGEMERAKVTLHRATEADVIVKAAERRPEVAKRLAEIQEKQRKGETGENSESVDGRQVTPMPAAPDFGAEMSAVVDQSVIEQEIRNETHTIQIEDMQQTILEVNDVIDSERAESELKVDDTIKEQVDELSKLESFSTTNMDFDYDAVYELSPTALLLVRSSLEDLQTEYEDGSIVLKESTELLVELERELITRGMTTDEAFKTIQTLTGN